MQALEISPNVEISKVARLLGGSKNPRLSHSVITKLHTLQGRLNRLIRPRLTYTVTGFSNDGKRILCADETIRFKSLKLARTLKDSAEMVCFVATIGRELEREIEGLQRRRRFSEAFILDALGSVAVEDMVNQFQRRMDGLCKANGKATTLRFSPGYCDWPVTEQKKLFRLVRAKSIGVELHDSCLMSPRKSISGVFGICANGTPLYHPCRDCRRSRCEARRS